MLIDNLPAPPFFVSFVRMDLGPLKGFTFTELNFVSRTCKRYVVEGAFASGLRGGRFYRCCFGQGPPLTAFGVMPSAAFFFSWQTLHSQGYQGQSLGSSSHELHLALRTQ